MWDDLSWRAKMLILEGESTVMVSMLIENAELVQLVKSGVSQKVCMDFINQNW